jgi:hypothetical protein
VVSAYYDHHLCYFGVNAITFFLNLLRPFGPFTVSQSKGLASICCHSINVITLSPPQSYHIT